MSRFRKVDLRGSSVIASEGRVESFAQLIETAVLNDVHI